MPESMAPIVRPADGRAAAEYARLGSTTTGEHRFVPDLWLYPGSAEATA